MALNDSFRTVRWVRTLNLLLQAVLFLTFFGGLNYVARNHPSRFDLTRLHRNSLSPETLSYLRNLTRPVHIIATISDDAALPIEVKGLLEEFVHASEADTRAPITTEAVNIYRERRRVEALGLDQAGVLLVSCADHTRAVTVPSLYETRSTPRGPQRVAFIGEQRLMAAVLDVSNPEPQHIYFLVGHGELEPDDTNPTRGLSALADELRIRNFKVDTLDLSINPKIPDDAALLVAVAPQRGFGAAEQEMLRKHLSVNAGRLILLLAPGIGETRLGLDDLLLDWGVLVYDDVIVESDPRYRAEDGDLIVRSFESTHPITQSLVTNNLYLKLGYTRTVYPDPARTLGGGLTTATVAASSKTAWGDVGFRIGLPPKFDNPGNTHPLPGMQPDDRLGIVVASERMSARNLPFSVRGGRLVVFGSGDFVSNQRIADGGNEAIFLNAVNWAVERDRELSVPARPIRRLQLALSSADLNRLNYLLWFALPGAACLLGLLVYWSRRK